MIPAPLSHLRLCPWLSRLGVVRAFACAGLVVGGACNVQLHEHGDPSMDPSTAGSSGPAPSARCPVGLVYDSGFCILAREVACGSAEACPAGTVCRILDTPACVCDPRPGSGESCAPGCTDDADCALGGECDLESHLCRFPISCLTDAECGWGERCVDGDWESWYVDGRGVLLAATTARRCAPSGYREEGERCQFSLECSAGACSGDLPQGAENQCGRPCYRNDHCETDEICLQLAWGPAICSTREDVCEPSVAPGLLCRLGDWVSGCRDGSGCPYVDCQFPDSTSVARDYGGMGFGSGRCLEERLCASDEVRSEWVDESRGPACFTNVACWDDADCMPGFSCLAMDAVETTWRCGYGISR